MKTSELFVCSAAHEFNDKGHAATSTTTMSTTWKLWNGMIWRIRVTKYNLFNGWWASYGSIIFEMRSVRRPNSAKAHMTYFSKYKLRVMLRTPAMHTIMNSVSIGWHRIQHFHYSSQMEIQWKSDCLFSIRSFRYVCCHFFWLSSSFMWCGMHVNYLNHICTLCISISCRLNAANAQKRTFI